MSHSTARLLYWGPRVLAMAFAAFLGIFALDAFEAGNFWAKVLAFGIHLIPSALVIGMLIIGWRHEWAGAGLFTLAAVFYAALVLPRHWEWAAILGIPLLVIAALFLANWVERGKLQSAL